MYQGESVQNLCCERLECGWIVIALENTNGMDDIQRKLDTYCIQDGYEDDYLVQNPQSEGLSEPTTDL